MAMNAGTLEHAPVSETSPIAFATGPVIDAAESLFKLCKRDNLTELSVSPDRGGMTYLVTIRVDLRSADAAITITRRPFHA